MKTFAAVHRNIISGAILRALKSLTRFFTDLILQGRRRLADTCQVNIENKAPRVLETQTETGDTVIETQTTVGRERLGHVTRSMMDVSSESYS